MTPSGHGKSVSVSGYGYLLLVTLFGNMGLTKTVTVSRVYLYTYSIHVTGVTGTKYVCKKIRIPVSSLIPDGLNSSSEAHIPGPVYQIESKSELK